MERPELLFGFFIHSHSIIIRPSSCRVIQFWGAYAYSAKLSEPDDSLELSGVIVRHDAKGIKCEASTRVSALDNTHA
jgi:hypothetical protein